MVSNSSILQDKFDGVDALIDLLNSKTSLRFFMKKKYSLPSIKNYQILCYNPKRIPGERNAPEEIVCGEVKVTLKRDSLYINIEVDKGLKKSFEYHENQVLDGFIKFMEQDVDKTIRDLITAP